MSDLHGLCNSEFNANNSDIRSLVIDLVAALGSLFIYALNETHLEMVSFLK